MPVPSSMPPVLGLASPADQRSIRLTAGDDELRAALQDANLPTLLLVLATFTGDRGWLDGPYRPTRTVALDDNDSGGFDPGRQAEIRAAAQQVLSQWRDSGAPAPGPPADDEIVPMLSVSLGEAVPPEYGPTLAQEAGFRPRSEVTWHGERPAAADGQHVIVIGAGLAGIAAAVTLRRLGIAFTVLEKNDAVGGVWRNNSYPGAAVDTPSHLYSYSFAPRRGWTRYYARRDEILGYIEQTAADFGVTPHVRFGTEVTQAVWDDDAQRWQLRARHGQDQLEFAATAVISCVGILNRPSVPALAGMDRFAGPMFHSAHWDHDLDVTGQRVAVIGTGATAMQVVPAIAGRAAQVLVFQRSPQWVVPNPNYLRDVPAGVRLLMEQVPYYASFYRTRLIWMVQDKLLATLHRDPDWPHQDRSVNAVNDKQRVFLTGYVDRKLGARTDLRPKVLPGYPPYGKRILMDNNWLTTVQRDDVRLVDDRVTGFDESHVITADGSRYEADVVVLATGFQSSRMLSPMDIRGRSPMPLREHWQDDNPFAYLGITVPGFPNFFIVGGPNTNIGHGGSAIYPAECAIAYIAQLLVRMTEDGIGAVEVSEPVCRAYNARVDAEHEGLIWTHPGTSNWFRNAHGRVTATTPWRGVDYWAMTRSPDLDDFHLSPAPAGS